MPDPEGLEVARDYALRIDKVPGVERILLFGSRARGEARHDSDVDVLVVVRTETPELRRLLLDVAFEVNMERGCWLVPAICPAEEVDGPAGRYDPFYVSAAKEGVLVGGR
jgi:hypothetical protein